MSNQNHRLAVQLALPKPTEHVSKTERTYSYLNYLTLHRRRITHTETPEGMSNEFEVYTRDILVDEQALLNFRVKPTQDTKDELEHELALNNHYALLNGYSHVVGMKWPVTERIWWHFYEMLPPLSYPKSEGFRVSEPCGSDKNGKTIWSAYYLENGQYWHEWVVMGDKQNPLTTQVVLIGDKAYNQTAVEKLLSERESLANSWIMSGRVFGDDDDTVLVVKATDINQAWQVFEEKLTDMRQDDIDNLDESDDVKIIQCVAMYLPDVLSQLG